MFINTKQALYCYCYRLDINYITCIYAYVIIYKYIYKGGEMRKRVRLVDLIKVKIQKYAR